MHINLIHSFYPQGFKLDLLFALNSGRFCLCNASVVQSNGLAHIAESLEEYIYGIKSIFEKDFNRKQVGKRVEILTNFANEIQGKKIVDLIWNV